MARCTRGGGRDRGRRSLDRRKLADFGYARAALRA
jgi:hypothetical protein